MDANPTAIEIAARAIFITYSRNRDAAQRWDADLVPHQVKEQFRDEAKAAIGSLIAAGIHL